MAKEQEAQGILWDHPYFPGLKEEDRKALHDIFHSALDRKLEEKEKILENIHLPVHF